MAANMIGVNKRIIVFDNGERTWSCSTRRSSSGPGPMIQRRDATGVRLVRRWQSIKVRWQNERFQERLKTFTGWTARSSSMRSTTVKALLYKEGTR